MDLKRRRLVLWSIVVVLVAGGTALVANDDYEGAETCAVCHEEVVKALEMTPHAVAPGWDSETACETCHGPGGEHIESGGEIDLIVMPTDLTPKESSKICMTCHEREERHFNVRQAIHLLADVGCVDCHNPHSTGVKMLQEPTALQLCSSCHRPIRAQFDLPRSHPLDALPLRDSGGNACARCHEPHASRSLRTSTPLFDQTCAACHFEKAGPFIYPHDVTIVDGCVACHVVHGSPNRHLLRHTAQVNLCYECHSASVTPPWHSAPRFLNEKCTACHTAIHGSNTSPFFLEE